MRTYSDSYQALTKAIGYTTNQTNKQQSLVDSKSRRKTKTGIELLSKPLILHILSFLDEIAIQRKLVVDDIIQNVHFDFLQAVRCMFVHSKFYIKCYRYVDFKCIFTIKDRFNHVLVTDQYIVSTRLHRLYLFDKGSGKLHHSIRLKYIPLCIAAAPSNIDIDGTKMAQSQAAIWVSTRTSIEVYSTHNNHLDPIIATDLSAKSLHFSPNSQYVAAHIDSSICIIETETFTTIQGVDVQLLTDFAFSPDSTTLLIVQQDEQVLYDFGQNTVQQLQYKDASQVTLGKFVSNDIVMLSTSDSTVLWNTSTKVVKTLPNDVHLISAPNQNSMRLASLSANGTHLVMCESRGSSTTEDWYNAKDNWNMSIYNIETLQLLQHIPHASHSRYNNLTSPPLLCRYAKDAVASNTTKGGAAIGGATIGATDIIICDQYTVCVWN